MITPSSKRFSIGPGLKGPQNVDADTFTVRYDFVDGLSPDSLTKTPSAITPDPYTGFDSSKVTFTTDTLGSGHLDNPTGVLTLADVGMLKAGETITFACEDWLLIRMETTENHSVEFIND